MGQHVVALHFAVRQRAPEYTCAHLPDEAVVPHCQAALGWRTGLYSLNGTLKG